MPTDFRLRRLECNYDLEQDPALWTCSWIGTEEPGGVINGNASTFDDGETLDDQLDNWAGDNDYTLL